MNKIWMYLVGVAAMLTACDPQIDHYDIGEAITPEQLNVDVTPIIVNGKNSNKVVVSNNSPVLGLWDNGIVTSNKKADTLLMIAKGAQNIQFTVLNADGSKFTKNFPVNIDELSFPVPAEWGLLCGETGKTWVWATDNPYGAGALYGNGPASATFPEWWQVKVDEMRGWGLLYDEITFDLNGGCNYTLVQKGQDGSDNIVVKDKFILNPTSKTLQTVEGTPFVRKVNVTIHNIVRLSENELTLTIPDGGNREVFMFKRKGYEY
ncbi:hypothetical protein EZS27_016112 [termite gut metagenome]|jgi:hypothetical protein|uniref:Uncharacterized protein n=1 Tax=termite gut metagenome TaxID=433724 RepID=A0A5J4RPV8_9ZZZZ